MHDGDVERPSISVVIPTRNRPDQLAECVKTVLGSLRSGDELIVADSASSDPRVREVAQANGCTYVRCEVRGASIARNAGWRAARHDIVAFVDDDVRVLPEWANGMARCFGRFPDAAFVTGWVGTPDDQGPSHAAPFLLHTEPAWIDDDFLEDRGHSANLGVRKSVLERVGGFDERLGAGAPFHAAEDKDLFDRLLGAGLRGRYEPTAPVIHLLWRDRRETLGLAWTYGFGTGARVAKLLKYDRQRARMVARDTIWKWGFREIWIALRRRHKWMTLLTTVRTAGMLAGFVRAIGAPVRDGRFVRHASAR